MAPKPGYEEFVRWSQAKLTELQERLAPIEAGTIRLGEKKLNGQWEDTTDGMRFWLEVKIEELEELIEKYSLPEASDA